MSKGCGRAEVGLSLFTTETIDAAAVLGTCHICNSKNVFHCVADNVFHFPGGGSAGAVVANRLSEVCRWSVLLLEAGTDESEASDIPLFSASLQRGLFDWAYKTEPQPGESRLTTVR